MARTITTDDQPSRRFMKLEPRRELMSADTFRGSHDLTKAKYTDVASKDSPGEV